MLGRALWKYPAIKLVGYSFLSNHYTLLLIAPDVESHSTFMRHLNGNLSKELGSLFGWEGPLWSRRYRPIFVGKGRWIQVNRLKYLLSQGCKEGLVARAAEWPGASSVLALTTGVTEKGGWFNRSAEYRARLKRKQPTRYQYSIEYPLEHAPLPCWERMSAAERIACCRELIAEIESEAAERNKALGRRPMGRKKILEQDAHTVPSHSARSPAPLSHGTIAERAWFKNLYWAFVRAYRAASARLRSGVLNALGEFPPGCFLPRISRALPLRFEPPPEDAVGAV